jgi:hypothetical protein
MASESVTFIGYCSKCEQAGQRSETGTKRRLMLRNGKPFCLKCGYV